MSNKLTIAIGGIAAVLILALAGILLLVVAGGGDKDDTGEPSASETSDDPNDNGDDEPAGSGELRIRGDDPLFLDPAVIQDAGSAFYAVEIFSGLVRLDRDLQIQPDVAERWDVSPDGKIYTFYIDPKATFHDGRPVVAEDFKLSWERALNPETASVVAENFLGDIVGAKDLSRGRADAVSGIEVVDDATLKVTLDAAKQYFLYKMAYTTAFVVDMKQITANPRRWTQKPNGTGPFKLREWKLGERIVLEAYERHHLGPPKLSTVRVALEGGSALVEYQDGDIDVTGIGLDDLESIQDPGNELNAEYQTTPAQSIGYIGFNTQTPPFDDEKVRQAFALTVDREKIGRVVLKSAQRVATGILAPGVPGYTPDDKTFPYNPDRARQLLSESKYAGDMPEIILAESGAGASVDDATGAIIQDWRDQLGVEVKIQQAESGTFFDDIDEGRYQMFSLGWIMDYPDPEDILDILFHSKSRQNNSRYSNPEVDQKLEAARIEPDTEARLALYREIELTILDDAPWIPLYFGATHALIKPYVKNYIFPPLVIEKFRDVEVQR